MDMSSEIQAFFAGATGWDFVIMGVLLLMMFKFLKRLFWLGLFGVALYYFLQYYG